MEIKGSVIRNGDGNLLVYTIGLVEANSTPNVKIRVG